MTPNRGSVLIITRHFPPAVSGGARRPMLLAEGLRQRGWRVHVASPSAPPGYQDWIETPHPAGRRGEAAAAGGKAQALSSPLRSVVRRALYWPDGDMRWALAVRSAVIRSGLRPDWLVTTSPPESAHLAGRLLKGAIGARWLAEFRDSWIEEPLREELRSSRLRRGLERRLARFLLKGADACICVSPGIATEIARLSGRLAPAVIGHFAKSATDSFSFESRGPNLVHSGRFTLSHPERVISAVLADFAAVARDIPDIRLHLVGRLTAEERMQAMQDPFAAQIILYGEVPYERSLAMQHAADGLILYQPGISALPGKFGEYLLATAPILTVGNGAWIDRLDAPHFPLRDAARALAAPRRRPANSLDDALDRYEAILSARRKPS